jgi:hypothetical protein
MCSRLYGWTAHTRWLGSFKGHGFTTQWNDVDEIVEKIGSFEESINIKGHMGHDPRIVDAFYENKWANVFIFRDPRDVAVSSAFHVTSDTDRLAAPAKEVMQDQDFDTVLEVIIGGAGVYDPLMERWEQYAGWLDEEHVMKVCYGDLVTNPRAWAGLLVRYLYGRTARLYGLGGLELEHDNYEALVEMALEGFRDKDSSPTYREGKLDKWKEYFTPEHKRLFKETDKNDWLVKLGFEENNEW